MDLSFLPVYNIYKDDSIQCAAFKETNRIEIGLNNNNIRPV